MHSLFVALGESWLGHATRNSANIFPACEALHFIGLSLLVGALLVIDLRVLGFVKRVSYAAILKLTPVAILGLTINVLTGIVMISNKPMMYYTNPAFVLKMAFVAFAALNAGWFMLVKHRKLAALAPELTAPLSVRVPAALSLTAWFVVILLGRLLPVFAVVPGG